MEKLSATQRARAQGACRCYALERFGLLGKMGDQKMEGIIIELLATFGEMLQNGDPQVRGGLLLPAQLRQPAIEAAQVPCLHRGQGFAQNRDVPFSQRLAQAVLPTCGQGFEAALSHHAQQQDPRRGRQT